MKNKKKTKVTLNKKIDLRVSEEVYQKLLKKAELKGIDLSKSIREDLDIITSVIDL